MNLGVVIALSGVSVGCSLTLALRLMRWQTILKLAWVIDVGFTLAMFAMFKGTLGGALVAACSGLILSVVLSAGRWIEMKKNEKGMKV